MHKSIESIKHVLVDGENGRELHTTVKVKRPTKKVSERLTQMQQLQKDMIANTKMLDGFQTGEGVEYTQTGVKLETMSSYITKSVETGLPLTTVTHDLSGISSDINDYIESLKNGGEIC